MVVQLHAESWKSADNNRQLTAKSGHSFAADAPFGMTSNEVEPTLFVGKNEARRSLRIADIRTFQCPNAAPLRERQLLMGSN